MGEGHQFGLPSDQGCVKVGFSTVHMFVSFLPHPKNMQNVIQNTKKYKIQACNTILMWKIRDAQLKWAVGGASSPAGKLHSHVQCRLATVSVLISWSRHVGHKTLSTVSLCVYMQPHRAARVAVDSSSWYKMAVCSQEWGFVVSQAWAL